MHFRPQKVKQARRSSRNMYKEESLHNSLLDRVKAFEKCQKACMKKINCRKVADNKILHGKSTFSLSRLSITKSSELKNFLP